jgi:hypothetical protein
MNRDDNYIEQLENLVLKLYKNGKAELEDLKLIDHVKYILFRRESRVAALFRPSGVSEITSHDRKARKN